MCTPRIRPWFALAVPGSHEQNFVAERIPEYVVDAGHTIEFKEARAEGEPMIYQLRRR
jgi:hypothetical protein